MEPKDNWLCSKIHQARQSGQGPKKGPLNKKKLPLPIIYKPKINKDKFKEINIVNTYAIYIINTNHKITKVQMFIIIYMIYLFWHNHYFRSEFIESKEFTFKRVGVT